MSLEIIGVIHVLPLPGTPHGIYSLQEVLDRAVFDAQQLQKGGVRTAVIENFGDAPFVRGSVEPHVVSMLTLIAHTIVRETGLSLGINVLRNDAISALAIASTCNARFIRVNVHIGSAWTDQGLIQGEAYNTLQYRKKLGLQTDIAADIMVKHAAPAGERPLVDQAKDCLGRGGASHVIVTGASTGSSVNWQHLRLIRDAIPNASIWIGSGLQPSVVEQAKDWANAAIVGTYFHEDAQLDKPLSLQRIEEILSKV